MSDFPLDIQKLLRKISESIWKARIFHQRCPGRIFAAPFDFLGKFTRLNQLLEIDIIVSRVAIHDTHARNDVVFSQFSLKDVLFF